MRLSGMAGAAMLVAMLGGGTAMGNQLPDLTGEWHGTELCDELDNGAPGVFAETSPIFIRQGKDGHFRMLFRLNDGKADVLYEGVLKQVAGGTSVEGVAIACGGAFESQEVIRLRPIASTNGQLFFNGELQFFTDDFPGQRRSREFRHLQVCLSARHRRQANDLALRFLAHRLRLSAVAKREGPVRMVRDGACRSALERRWDTSLTSDRRSRSTVLVICLVDDPWPSICRPALGSRSRRICQLTRRLHVDVDLPEGVDGRCLEHSLPLRPPQRALDAQGNALDHYHAIMPPACQRR